MGRLFSVLSLMLLLFQINTVAQTPSLSESSTISLLTCGSGEELYSSFGHTAFRVQDPALGIDVVYNYGTFDFNKPNFYLNFAKGKLIYSLSRTSFERFLYEYELEKRWVREQIFDLNLAERNRILAFLENNYKPENRDYAYDPLLNNCSSITGDILIDQFNGSIEFKESHLKKQYSFRQLVRQYLSYNSWSAFGIDLAFGSVVDRVATVREHMFMPYYAMYQLRNTTKRGKPLVKRERVILDYAELEDNSFFPLSPLFWFSLLFVFICVITYLDRSHKARSRWLDFSIFLVTGLVGTILLILWLATDHTSTPYNYNVLWAMPFNLVFAFILLAEPRFSTWMSKYLLLLLGLMALVILLWIVGVQSFSPVLIPLFLALGVRYLYLLKISKLP
ncbi:DUF4105 domain-containing protein [Flagellimonas allohymeniacidonis]|uniref:DUF4105 domain-containing protein n=1 Tax=Flagellimonas allohymeniacidonis TaxID=2517819 RepID=A0A4Q8QHT1_9FLAO|nr:DUF4105 domain-containing protein [Allomuricauda hymeniacidonis]TAI49357.1 DUF4105 domain-containing protein [Allomuricauda hymeniacidonis]